MTPRPTYVALLLAAALTAGCSASADHGPATRHDEQHAAGHDAQHGTGHDDEHGAGHGAHLSAYDLDALLLTEADLPAGYRTGGGHHHGDADAAPPQLSPACEPLGWLIGEHPAVLQTEHPQARASFGMGHYGPQITETVIDFGDPGAARAAYREVAAAAACERYVQSTARTGSNVYSVVSARPRPGGTTLRLDAVGRDFDGLHWDVSVSRRGELLVSVALRTALGGTAEDLGPAVDAALDRARLS